MKSRIYRIEFEGNSFETIDKKCIAWYKKAGAVIIKKNSFVIRNY